MFDTATFLTEHFKNAQTVLALFRVYGLDVPKVSTAEKWFQRRSVPGHVLPILLCIAELEQGEPVRLAPYIKRG